MTPLTVLRTGLLAGVFCLATTVHAGHDYTKVPASPAEVSAELSAAGVSLSEAIAVAEKATEGRAGEASWDGAVGGYAITVYTDSQTWDVTVDGAGEVTDKTAVPRFPGDPVTGEWTETASGLKYFDIREGDGESPAGPSSKVTVHYCGWLNDGTKFDCSYDRGMTIDFFLNQVIPGWTEGVGSMKVGGKRKLILPHQIAYGARGSGPIPPKALLIFDVELIDIPQM